MNLPSLQLTLSPSNKNEKKETLDVPRLDLSSILTASNRPHRDDLPGWTCEAFAQLWSETHFWTAIEEKTISWTLLTGVFGGMASKWQVCAPALRGHPICFVPLPETLWDLRRPNRLLGEWFEALLEPLRKGEKAVILPFSTRPIKGKELSIPSRIGSLMQLGAGLPAKNRRQFFSAFKEERLDFATHLRLDFSLSTTPHRYEPFHVDHLKPIIDNAPPATAPQNPAEDDNQWFFHAFCHPLGLYFGPPNARQEWLQELCRLWIEQHTDQGRLTLQNALSRATQHFPWAHLPKASSPLPLTPKESAFSEQLDIFHALTLEHGWNVPEQLSQAFDVLTQRRAKLNAPVVSTTLSPALDLDTTDQASPSQHPTLTPQLLSSRRELALTSISYLDVEAFEWVLQAGLQGADLSFEAGTTRGGPLEVLARAFQGNSKDSSWVDARLTKGVQVLRLLFSAGYDPFVLPKNSSHRRREESNIFIRCSNPFLLAFNQSNALLEALAFLLVERCKQHGLSFLDSRSWIDDLRNRERVLYKAPSPQMVEVFGGLLTRVIEREELQASLLHGDTPDALTMGSTDHKESSSERGDETDSQSQTGRRGRRRL